jgi:hypothetical protein
MGDITTVIHDEKTEVLPRPFVESSIVFRPHPFATPTHYAVAQDGQNVGEIVSGLELDPVYREYVRVWIDDIEVPVTHWDRVRPRPGRNVYVSVVPRGGGGGGKNLFRTIAFIAVAIAAVAIAGPLAGAMFTEGALAATTFTIGAAKVSLLTAAVGVALTMVGNALVNALIPPPKPNMPSYGDSGISSPRSQITGTSNRLTPYGNIPRVFGKRRIYPVLGALPYTEMVGSDEYFRMALVAGWGPLKISDIKIGETPITAFEGVEYEIREGWSSDTDLTLFTRSVNQQDFNIVLDGSGDPWTGEWSSRTTEPSSIEISVDIALPQGLAYYNDQGGRSEISVEFEVQYRQTGTVNWVSPTWANAADAGFGTAGKITVTGADTSAVRKSGRITVAEGQYDVRVRKTTAPRGSRYLEYAVWNVLRYVTPEKPIIQKGLSLIALRIKATGQLNGVPQQVNCIAESYLPVWSGTSWSYQITRNPAWAFVDILRRRANETFIADSRIDLTAMRNWALACDVTAPNASEPYWTFDAVIEGGSVFEALKQIGAHARANYTIRDGKHSVVRDIAQTVPVQHITPRNSTQYIGHKAFIDYPHALRVRFVNSSKGYQEDEHVVYYDGFNAANATVFETVELPGCSSATQAWREGRYQHAVGRLRPEDHTVTMDIEALRCTLGDYVLFTHDVISIGIMSSRVKSRTVNGSNQVTALQLEDDCYFEPGVTQNYVVRVRKANGDTQLLSLVSNLSGYQSTLTLLTPVALGSAPAVGDLAMFGVADRETAPMIVKKIEPGPDFSVTLTLVDAQPGVWTADQGSIPAFDTNITVTTPPSEVKPATPVIMNVRTDETVLLRMQDGTLLDRIYVEVLPGASNGLTRTAFYDVQYRQVGAAVWGTMPQAPAAANSIYIPNVVGGNSYQFRIRAVSDKSIAGDWTSVQTVYVIGKTTVPDSPSNFSAVARVDGVQLSWTASPSLDVIGYTIKRGNDWASAELVTVKFSGNSIFVGIDDVSAQTFLLKAIDAVGLESASPLSVTAQAVAPDDVLSFDVYARTDYIAFSWKPVYGVGVQYEVRVGETWATANIVGRVSGDKLETQYPVKTTGDKTYWIKAISAAGLYSTNAAFATTRQAPIPNRNVVITRDWGALGYPGIRHDLTINATALELSKINGVNAGRGDYYSKLTLGASYYARSWTEVSAASVSNSGTTWAGAAFTWNTAGTQTWAGVLGETDAGLVSVYISKYLAALNSGEIEGFSLVNTLLGQGGTNAAEQQDVAYAPCRFDNGLSAVGTTKAAWNVSIPSTFSVAFDFRSDTFLDQDQVLLTLRAGSGYLRLVYDSVRDTFVLFDHVGNGIEVSVPVVSGDTVTFGISQSVGARYLHAASRRNTNPVSASAPLSPVGNFTQLSITA